MMTGRRSWIPFTAALAGLALMLLGCAPREGDDGDPGQSYTEPGLGPEALDPDEAPPPGSERDKYWRYQPPASVKTSVKEIQRIVGIAPDGEYGPATKAAVKRYQLKLKKAGQYKGPADGIWGPATDRAAAAARAKGK